MKILTDWQRPAPSTENLPKSFDRSGTIRNIRRLIWLYLWLLIFEGSFRKWILPEFSAPLLLIRDPVVLAIYFLAFRARVFPQNVFVVTIEILAILSWATGIIVLLPYLPIKTIVLITGYGARCNFLHLPLVFIIPAVFNLEDVKRIGWWTIVGMVPMAILMVMQFNSAPDSFINRAAGLGEGTQIQAGGGKIRPPAFFSFISGTVYYVSATAAFLLHALLAKLPYRQWLLYASAGALILALGVSGSRSAVLAIMVVMASLAIILLVRPALVGRFGRLLLFAALLLAAISYVPIFREGLGVLSDRFTESTQDDESIVGGLVSRTIGSFTEGLLVLNRVPIGGYGLGVGTSGGASFLVGQAGFLLAENEWSRILLESGPILGLAFLIWRTALVLQLLRFALREVGAGNTLPMLLFGAGVFVFLQGPFGQPTTVGFAVILAGLAFAARSQDRVELEPAAGPVPEPNELPPPPKSRRSAYAERLHDPGGSSHHSNGSSGR
jgi:hypothetical protein